MPPSEPSPSKSLDEVVEELGLYPREAFEFVRHGLNYTVNHLHGSETDPEVSRHVSGQQLCEGLRDYALKQWGLLAPTVLGRWNIRRTDDFGKIVFTLVENGHMSKTDDDRQEDFKNVFNFATAFDAGYRMGMKSAMSPAPQTPSAQPNKTSEKAKSIPAMPPLKPRPRLLVVLSVIFALWVAGLLTMYFKTVYPYSHDASRNAPERD